MYNIQILLNGQNDNISPQWDQKLILDRFFGPTVRKMQTLWQH